MPSDVRGVRREIEALIGEGEVNLSAERLQDWAIRLKRDAPVSKRKSSPPMTRNLAEKIRLLDSQGMSQSQIAAKLSINSGRVSEVLTGRKWSKQ